MKLIYPKNPEAALTQKILFKQQFKELEFLLPEDGDEPIPIKDGKRVEDRFNNPVKFSQLIEERASKHWDIAVQDGKGSAGNESGQGGSGSSNGVPDKFESDEAYNKFIDDHPGEENHDIRYKAMEIHKANPPS